MESLIVFKNNADLNYSMSNVAVISLTYWVDIWKLCITSWMQENA
jgi:hypothetical protein